MIRSSKSTDLDGLDSDLLIIEPVSRLLPVRPLPPGLSHDAQWVETPPLSLDPLSLKLRAVLDVGWVCVYRTVAAVGVLIMTLGPAETGSW